MKQNRRQFLKLTAAVVAGMAVKLPGEVQPGFDPKVMYGDFVTLTDWNDADVNIAYEQILAQVRKTVPLKYRNTNTITFIFKPLGSCGTIDPMDQRGIVGWKYKP